MNILFANPNTSQAVTDRIAAVARASVSHGTCVTAVTAAAGVPYIATRAEAVIGARAVLELFAGHSAGMDAAVVAAFGDPGLGAARLGRISPGATADLTVIDLSHPQLQPLADPRRGLVALANRADIAQVFVAGKLLVDAERLANGDEQAICAAGAAAIQRIWDLTEARAALPQ